AAAHTTLNTSGSPLLGVQTHRTHRIGHETGRPRRQVCWSLDSQVSRKRMRPGGPPLRDWRRNDGTPLIFDAQRVVAVPFPDLVCAHTILSRSIPNRAKFFR